MWLLLACAGGDDSALDVESPASADRGPDIDIEPWVVEVGTLASGEGANAALTIANLGDENLDLTSMTLEELLQLGLEVSCVSLSLECGVWDGGWWATTN